MKRITVMKYLKCLKCDFVLTIHRKANKNQPDGHIKHMWCPKCKKKTAHKELPEFEGEIPGRE